jgi:hypothetical protein
MNYAIIEEIEPEGMLIGITTDKNLQVNPVVINLQEVNTFQSRIIPLH